MAEVRLTLQAHDLLTQTQAKGQERLTDALRRAGEASERVMYPLEGYPYHSVHAGDYPALVDWDRGEDVLWVFAVGHRRNVYDRYLPP